MGRKNFRKAPLELENIVVEDAGAEGKTLARIDGMVTFITGGVPGDVVDLLVFNRKKTFWEGKVTAIKTPSPMRIDAFCEHFGVCGGCKWQNMGYTDQLGFKHKQVLDNLERIAKVELPEITPILGSVETKYYRNKLEYTFSDSRWRLVEESENPLDKPDSALGYHIPGRFDKILDIDNCYLQPNPSNAIRLFIKQKALELAIPFYNLRTHEGFLRTMVIRNTLANEWMLILTVKEQKMEWIENLLDAVIANFPQLTSVNYVINPKLNDTFSDLPVENYFGKAFITEKLSAFKPNEEPLHFKVGPKSFFQTNSTQTEKLYAKAAELANLQPHETVYDLYTGTGTIACYVARYCKQVIGIEYVAEAIEDAKENMELNNLSNLKFFAGDMKDVLNDAFLAAHGRPDVIITDPPRAGMHEDVVKTILRAAPNRIVYVSCNPATQARDLAWLDETYKVMAVQPVDMFPHTHHVENIVLLEKR